MNIPFDRAGGANEVEKHSTKRGRPKKIKTQEEIDVEKRKKKEIKQKILNQLR